MEDSMHKEFIISDRKPLNVQAFFCRSVHWALLACISMKRIWTLLNEMLISVVIVSSKCLFYDEAEMKGIIIPRSIKYTKLTDFARRRYSITNFTETEHDMHHDMQISHNYNVNSRKWRLILHRSGKLNVTRDTKYWTGHPRPYIYITFYITTTTKTVHQRRWIKA